MMDNQQHQLESPCRKTTKPKAASSSKKIVTFIALIIIIPLSFYAYNNSSISISISQTISSSSIHNSPIPHPHPMHASPNNTHHSTTREEDDEEEEEARESNYCNLSLGEWVPNPQGPYYTNATCSHIQDHQNCIKYGRPDTHFLKWRWKPQACHLPIFDPLQFFNIMTGKKLAFVGDSVARNHMQSLICLLSKVEKPVDVSETSSLQFKTYHYRKHNFSIAMFWSPYLVRIDLIDPTESSGNQPFNLFLDEPDPRWTQQIPGFNYVIISAGQWFFRPTIYYIQARLAGCLYCPQSNIPHLTAPTFAYRLAFRTALRAIAQQVNFPGITFLRSFVPSHFENGDWDKGGDCVRQRPYRPDQTLLDGRLLDFYEIQLEKLKIARRVGRERGLKFRMIDVTRAMLMRPDGHPSKYGHWPIPYVTQANDCVHWCLPGPVDSWNDFLIELLRREEQQGREIN